MAVMWIWAEYGSLFILGYVINHLCRVIIIEMHEILKENRVWRSILTIKENIVNFFIPGLIIFSNSLKQSTFYLFLPKLPPYYAHYVFNLSCHTYKMHKMGL